MHVLVIPGLARRLASVRPPMHPLPKKERGSSQGSQIHHSSN